MNTRPYLTNDKQGGFTLIEVLVCVIIIALIMVPLATSYLLHHRLSLKAGGETMAAQLAQGKLEEMKDVPYAMVVNQNGTFVDYPGYNYTVEVSTGAFYLKTVTVTVTYPAGNGTAQITLQTERANR